VRGRLIAFIAAAVLLVIAVVFAVRELPTDGAEAGTAADASFISSLLPARVAATGLPEKPPRPALEELCAAVANETGDSGETNPRLLPFDELQEHLLGRLSVSPTAEHLILAAFLDDDSASRIGIIDRAVSSNRHDAFTLWNAVHICTEEHEATGCPLRDWEQQLLRVDGQNSESWIRVAANRYESRDLDGALEALKRAAASAETRAYWTETIEMAERGLAAGADLSFQERATMAFNIASSNLPLWGDYMDMCGAQSAIDVDWAYACLAYGRTLENQGRTFNGLLIGLAIQEASLEALSDRDGLARLEQRKAARSRELSALASDKMSMAEQLVTSTPDEFSSYLASVRRSGEWDAMAIVVEEASALIQHQPELACIPET